MKAHSQWIFDCDPDHVWPHFLNAKMDNDRPLMFRFGMPKPVSCRVVDGDIAVGGTRRCTTERGTSDQQILSFEDERFLHYKMIDSSMPLGHWVAELEDTFTLKATGDGRTIVTRETVFSATRPFALIKQIGIWIFLKQTHAYAARNWRRLSEERAGRNEAGAAGMAAGSV